MQLAGANDHVYPKTSNRPQALIYHTPYVGRQITRWKQTPQTCYPKLSTLVKRTTPCNMVSDRTYVPYEEKLHQLNLFSLRRKCLQSGPKGFLNQKLARNSVACGENIVKALPSSANFLACCETLNQIEVFDSLVILSAALKDAVGPPEIRFFILGTLTLFHRSISSS